MRTLARGMTVSKGEGDAILHTVIISSERIHDLAELYRIGLELPEARATGDDHLGFQLPNLYFGFDRVESRPAGPAGAISLWFEVEDLDATFHRFKDLGAKVKYPPTRKPWGAVLAAVLDPDGNVVGLAQRGTSPG